MAGTTVRISRATLSTLQQLGHAKPQTTARYSHVADSARRDVVETVARLVSPVQRRQVGDFPSAARNASSGSGTSQRNNGHAKANRE